MTRKFINSMQRRLAEETPFSTFVDDYCYCWALVYIEIKSEISVTSLSRVKATTPMSSTSFDKSYCTGLDTDLEIYLALEANSKFMDDLR